MVDQSKWPVAKGDIRFNGVLAYTAGHPVDPDAVKAHGWEDLVVKPGTKTAEKAVEKAEQASG